MKKSSTLLVLVAAVSFCVPVKSMENNSATVPTPIKYVKYNPNTIQPPTIVESKEQSSCDEPRNQGVCLDCYNSCCQWMFVACCIWRALLTWK